MRATIRNLVLVTVASLTAANGLAALSQSFVDFGNGPARWLMTPNEQTRWKSINSDADAQAFIDLFWARRDPSPGTAANEYHDRFDALVKAADDQFREGKTRGSMTERGRIFVIFGPPARVVRTDPVRNSASGTAPDGMGQVGAAGNLPGEAVEGTPARQIWTWEKGKGDLPFEGPTFEVAFTDKYGNGTWKVSPGRSDVGGLMTKVLSASIVSPNMTEAPKPQPGTTTTRTTTTTSSTTVTEAVAPPAPALPPLATPALQAAIQAAKGGTSTIGKGSAVVFAELVSPAGDFFTPVGIYVPKSAGVAADGVDTFFGSVEDASGKVVASFEEPAKTFSSNGDLLVDETIGLPSGKYTAELGVAKGGQPVAVATKAFEVTEVPKDAVGISRLILSNNPMAETEIAAPVKAPFAFGKLKVVPKGDLVFSNKDELGYFIEIHNPGIDPTSKMPKLQSKIELSGGNLKSAIAAPLADAQALPLTGSPGPGQYAIVNSIPLSQMTTPLAPGSYTLRVKLIDTINKQSYTAEQAFKIE